MASTNASAQLNGEDLPSPIKAIVLAIPFALLGSIIATIFLFLEDHLITAVWQDLPKALGMTEPAWWLVVLLPLIGAAIVMIAWRLPGRTGSGPLEGLHFDVTPAIFASVILAAFGTLIFGLSLGPEAPLLACGTAAGAFVLRRQPDPVMKFGMLMTALAAIAAIFGSPIVVVLMLAEFTALGRIPAAALMPGFVALGVAYVAETGVGGWSGLGSSSLAVPGLPELTSTSATDILVGLAVSLVAAVVTLIARKFGQRIAVMARSNPPLVLIGVALLTSGLAIAVREITRTEIPMPPWKRISATPIENSSEGPGASIGTSTRSITCGPAMMPASTRTTMLGRRRYPAIGTAIRPTASTMPIVRSASSTSIQG